MRKAKLSVLAGPEWERAEPYIKTTKFVQSGEDTA